MIKMKFLKNYLLKKSETTVFMALDFFVFYLIYSILMVLYFPKNTLFIQFESLFFGSLNILLLKLFGNYSIFWNHLKVRNVYYLILSIIVSVTLILIYNEFKIDIEHIILLALLSFNISLMIRIIFISRYLFLKKKIDGENTIIIGAGNAGIQLCEKLLSSPSLKSNPIGFLDDAVEKHGKKFCGVSVLGNIRTISEVKEKFDVSKVVLAIPSASASQVLKVSEYTKKANLKLSTIPSLHQILDNKVNQHNIKEIEPSDLLGRESINLDLNLLHGIITKDVVLVTGAGGSIGSEICVQIAKLSPSKIILFEQTELFLYKIEMKMKSLFPSLIFVSVIGDIRDINTVEMVISKYLPSIIFHAAAYKHVPIMEENPHEALTTNFFGTYNLATLAVKYDVQRFLLISTDKAVNPTNIMGATKRAAEIACQIISEDSLITKFMIVRFGNVLGSSGSVIPLFKSQIKEGGPITITHREITRYFMSITEASQLVIYASAIGEGGELFVLDMGKPVKILDLARDMISLCGFEPEVDIKIKYTGLRKGEKMYEELLLNKEKTLKTVHPKIYISERIVSNKIIRKNMQQLIKLKDNKDSEKVKKLLKKLIPEFSQNKNI